MLVCKPLVIRIICIFKKKYIESNPEVPLFTYFPRENNIFNVSYKTFIYQYNNVVNIVKFEFDNKIPIYPLISIKIT